MRKIILSLVVAAGLLGVTGGASADQVRYVDANGSTISPAAFNGTGLVQGDYMNNDCLNGTMQQAPLTARYVEQQQQLLQHAGQQNI